jgi:ornithine carbamoyltransferase
VLSRHMAAIGLRTGADALIEELAEFASVPVFNMLTAGHHPCQALADLMTLREAFGHLEGLKVAYVGDGNNVARSLAVASALLGLEFVLAAPFGYEFPGDFRSQFSAAFPDIPLVVEHEPDRAVAGADVVYTDVWASMGQEHEAERRRAAFQPFQVDDELLGRAKTDAIFLHCLPAHRGEEVSADVIDGTQSVIYDEAENRLHIQKAIMHALMKK